MILKCIKTALLFGASILFFTSCEEKLQTEFGNSKVYFSNTFASLVLKDSATLDEIAAQTDTTVYMIGLYRSGIVDNLEELKLTLSIDSAALDSVISKAQTAFPAEMTDIMTKYKNSKALGVNYCSVPATVIIPQGQRAVSIPVTLRKSLIKLYNNAYFNYSAKDFVNTNVIKSRILIIPLKITNVNPYYPILSTQQKSYLEITKRIGIK
ncbi:MAG: hypothetical protein ACOYMD_02795 [Paludibacter sp.]